MRHDVYCFIFTLTTLVLLSVLSVAWFRAFVEGFSTLRLVGIYILYAVGVWGRSLAGFAADVDSDEGLPRIIVSQLPRRRLSAIRHLHRISDETDGKCLAFVAGNRPTPDFN